MEVSSRVQDVPPYLFVQISQKIAQKRSQGADVISFGIGDPDIPTPDPVIDALCKAAYETPNHRYPETDGLPAFREAVANWYKDRFQVDLDPDKEVLPLIGAKEGIGHASLCFINPGDIALIPDPGYPVYSVGTLFAGGQSHILPLYEKDGWLPELASIPEQIAMKSKVMWINYPNNPTGAVASFEYFKDVVDFAKKNNIIILHDACYTDVAYDNFRPISFLEIEGAKDIGIEFHSLSKTYNMTGWRVGMVVGNQELINSLMIIKSNLDSGVPQAVQIMGIEAMRLPQSYLDERNAVYATRRDKIVNTLNSIGLEVEKPKASLYVWAKVPEGYSSGEFSERVLEDTDIVLMAGRGYGEYGEGYVRLSVTINNSDLDRGLERLSSWKIPPPTL